jgi:hypothetical protein
VSLDWVVWLDRDNFSGVGGRPAPSGVRSVVGAIAALFRVLAIRNVFVATGSCHRESAQGEDCAVGGGEPWSADLPVENEDSAAESKDLSIAAIAGGEYRLMP